MRFIIDWNETLVMVDEVRPKGLLDGEVRVETDKTREELQTMIEPISEECGYDIVKCMRILERGPYTACKWSLVTS